MRIGEASRITGLGKKAIQHYISEGLVSPATEENGYFDFSDEDIASLRSIRQLRALGMSLSVIRGVLDNPQSARYQIAAHRKRLHQEQHELEEQLARTEALLGMLEENHGSVEGLRRALDGSVPNVALESEHPLSWDDAETIALFLMGHFVDAGNLTMYQQFLSDRLRQVILTNQDDAALALRDMLNDAESAGIESYGFIPRESYERTGFSSLEECRAHLKDIVRTLEQGLSSTELRKRCRKNLPLNYCFKAFLDNREVCTILEGISPYFAALWRSYQVITEILAEHLETDAGKILAHSAGSLLGHDSADASELALLYPFFASGLAESA